MRSDATGRMFSGWRLVAVGALIILLGREIGDGLLATAWCCRVYEGDGIGQPWAVVAIWAGLGFYFSSLWFSGWAVDRWGPNRMVQIGLPLVGLVALLTTVPAPAVLHGAIVGMGALGMIGAHMPVITALNNWFRDRLALALALMFFAVAIGGKVIGVLMAALLLLLLVDWRLLTALSGALGLVAALPLARAVRNRPEDLGEHPEGLTPAPMRSIPGYTWREAARSRQFWMLVAPVPTGPLCTR